MSNKPKYSKKALTVDKQIELLTKRGLKINNIEEARHYLTNISYYNLSGYCKSYQNKSDQFHRNTSFNSVLDLYFFDRKLRLLFINALERIEKSFKTQFVYHLSITHGRDHLISNPRFQTHRKRINDNLRRSKEPFVKNFKKKYSNEHPPLWILAEVLSFGDILTIFYKSTETTDKKEITKYYQVNHEYLHSWLDNLREIRNICAHHSRLWNRKITKHIKQSKKDKHFTYNNNIYDSIIITQILLNKISPKFNWLEELKVLIEEYDINTDKMGFPSDWKEVFKEISVQS